MWKHARAGNAAITLRLDDRYFGPVERKPLVEDDSILEALCDDEHSVPAWVNQSKATGSPESLKGDSHQI